MSIKTISPCGFFQRHSSSFLYVRLKQTDLLPLMTAGSRIVRNIIPIITIIILIFFFLLYYSLRRLLILLIMVFNNIIDVIIYLQTATPPFPSSYTGRWHDPRKSFSQTRHGAGYSLKNKFEKYHQHDELIYKISFTRYSYWDIYIYKYICVETLALSIDKLYYSLIIIY